MSDEDSNLADRPVTNFNTAGAGIEYNYSSVEHVKCGEILVTELIPVRGLDTENIEGVNDNYGTIGSRNKCVH